jgi:hypothetical protein
MAIRILSSADDYYATQLASDNEQNAAADYVSQFLSRPDIAATLSANQQAYPHLTPGAALSLGQAGQGPTSPVTEAVATAAANRKVQKGFGWHTIGDIVSTPAHLLGTAIGYVAKPVAAGLSPLKPATRVIFTAMDSALQELDAVARQQARDIHDKGIVGGIFNGARAFNPLDAITGMDRFKQTTAYQALPQSVGGGGQSMGSGFFTNNSPAGQVQAAAARSVYQIDGHAGTMGRILARTVFEPGTRPYNALSGTLDAAKAWFLDPAQLALTSSSEARAANRILKPGTVLGESGDTAAHIASLVSNPEEAARVAGLISTAPRNTVEDLTAINYATHGSGQKFIQWATDNPSTYDIWTKLGGPRGKLPLTVARDLAASTSDAETLAVFNQHFLSGVIRDKPYVANPLSSIIKPVGGWTAGIRQSPDSIRLFASFPRDLSVDANHLDDLAIKLRAQLQNARVGKDVIALELDRLAYAQPHERLQTVADAMAHVTDRVAGQVDADGIILGGKALKPGDKVYSAGRPTSGRVLNITDRPSTWEDIERPDELNFYADKTARVEFNVDGQIIHEDLPVTALSARMPYSKARQLSHFDMERIAAPFREEVASNTPVLGGIVGSTPIDLAPPHAMAEASAPMVGYLPNIRDLRGEFSKVGHILNDPRIAWAPDALDKFRSVWLPATLLRASGSIRSVMSEQAVMGAQGYTSLFRHPISHIATIVGRRAASSATGSLLSDAEELQTLTQFSGKGWIDGLVKHGSKVLRPTDPEFTSKWADRLTSLSRDPLAAKIAGNWDDAPDFARTGNNVLDSKAWFSQVRVPQLREGIDPSHWSDILKSQSAADKYVEDFATQIQHYTRADPGLTEVVARGTLNGAPTLIDTGGNASLADALTTYTRNLHLSGNSPDWVGAARAITDTQHKGLNHAVDVMFHGLWQVPMEKLTLAPLFKQLYWERASETLPLLTRDAQAEVLRNAAQAGFKRSELRAMAGNALRGEGALTVEESHALAMDHAINKSRDMLYDLHNRSQFGDIARHFTPFFDAWKYNIEQAARIGFQHPEAIRKFQLAVEGARGDGFFHIDQNGQEVFTFPGSEFVNSKLPFGPHARIPFEAPVQGLNMAAQSILPGLGPIVQIPLGHILPDRPDIDWIRHITMPYGETTLGGSLTPPWVDKILTGFGADQNKDRNFANAKKSAARYLMSTGTYDLSDPTSANALDDKSTELAKRVFYFRGLFQWLAPSAPSPDWRAFDKDGRLLSQYKMSQEFKSMTDKFGYDDGVAAFLTTFGPENLLAIQPFSKGTSPQSSADYNWERTHPDVTRDYPDAYTYFAPQDTRKAPYEAYVRSFDTGTRQTLTFREWTTRANDRVGSMIYYNAKDALGPKPAQNQLQWLSGLRDFLKQKYPGFDPEAADPSRTGRVIDQLYQAANTGLLATTPAGRGIQQYLALRDQAMQSATNAGLRSGFSSAKSAQPIRDWLAQNAARIAERYPDFTRVYDQVFSHEVS